MNGDGHADLVTGSFGGVAYVLYGGEARDERGLRQFGPPTLLLDLLGEPVCIGVYQTQGSGPNGVRAGARLPRARMLSVLPIDWDSDGDLDLVAGEVDGRILWFENDGTKTEPAFKPEPRRIRAGRKSLWVKSGHSMVSGGDWDGDGLLDLVSGSSDGSVVLWPGIARAEDDGSDQPAFGKPIELVSAYGTPEAPEPLPPTRSGVRTQPHLADLDGDGTMELLVGDYRSRTTGDEETPRASHGFVWVFRSKAR